VVNVDRWPDEVPVLLVRCDLRQQLLCQCRRRLGYCVDELRVPIPVQFVFGCVLEAANRYFDCVAALIVVVRDVQRLVHVAHEVKKDLSANRRSSGSVPCGRACSSCWAAGLRWAAYAHAFWRLAAAPLSAHYR
jgi:hypothetical protein